MDRESRQEPEVHVPLGDVNSSSFSSEATPVKESLQPEVCVFVEKLKSKETTHGMDAVCEHLRLSRTTFWRYEKGDVPSKKAIRLAAELDKLGAASDWDAGGGNVFSPDVSKVTPMAGFQLAIHCLLGDALKRARADNDQLAIGTAMENFRLFATTLTATIGAAPDTELPRLYGLLGATYFVVREWGPCRDAYSRGAALAKFGNEPELQYRYELSLRSPILKMLWLQYRNAQPNQRAELFAKANRIIAFVQNPPPDEAHRQDLRQRYAMLLRFSSAYKRFDDFQYWVWEALDDDAEPYEPDDKSAQSRKLREERIYKELRALFATNDDGEMDGALNWLDLARQARV